MLYHFLMRLLTIEIDDDEVSCLLNTDKGAWDLHRMAPIHTPADVADFLEVAARRIRKMPGDITLGGQTPQVPSASR